MRFGTSCAEFGTESIGSGQHPKVFRLVVLGLGISVYRLGSGHIQGSLRLTWKAHSEEVLSKGPSLGL